MNRYSVTENTTFLYRSFDDVFEELLGVKVSPTVKSDLIKERMKRETFHTRSYLRVSLQYAIKWQCGTGLHHTAQQGSDAFSRRYSSSPCATLPKLSKSSQMSIDLLSRMRVKLSEFADETFRSIQ